MDLVIDEIIALKIYLFFDFLFYIFICVRTLYLLDKQCSLLILMSDE